MKVIYDPGIKEPVLSILKTRVPWVEHAFPSWCNEVIVKYKEEELDDDYAAVITVEYQYRYCKLVIYPKFITSIDWYGTLMHEIYHAVFSPYTLLTHRIVDNFVTDEKTKDFILQELAFLEEQVTEDSAHCVKCLLDFPKKDVIS